MKKHHQQSGKQSGKQSAGQTSEQLSAHTSVLIEALGVSFHDPRLLQSALIHRSFLNEHPEPDKELSSNERLEFLGDAVLNMIAADWLYHFFPERAEGELTTLRASLVKTTTLARFAREINLGHYVRIGRGGDTQAARERPGLLADVFEAVLGAIYLDQGLDSARSFVLPFLQAEVERIFAGQVEHDYRTRLQELVQAEHGITPTYRTLQVSGPDHSREFTVEVCIGEQPYGVGCGSSKQNAAQDAARSALAALAGSQGSQPAESEGDKP
jgi:ribonuclease-3